jgi:hypothetical protein
MNLPTLLLFSLVEERCLYPNSAIPVDIVSVVILSMNDEPERTVSTHAEKRAPNSTHMFPSPRSNKGASSSSACFSKTFSSLFNREALSVLSSAVR